MWNKKKSTELDKFKLQQIDYMGVSDLKLIGTFYDVTMHFLLNQG